jgi:hypothetical protein
MARSLRVSVAPRLGPRAPAPFGYTAPQMAEPGTASAARVRQEAKGRELLADSGALWSALPVEWPREAEGGSEAALPGWGWRVRRSLAALLARPRRSFQFVHEPVDHGAPLRLLLTVRLPLWAVLLAAVALGYQAEVTYEGIPALDAHLVAALSLWLLLMAPVGVPVLYASLGIATHVALVLTGGAPRSIAATMRAVGYALVPALLGVALLDLPLYLGLVSLETYGIGLAALTLLLFVVAGNALTGTHQLPALRGFVVATVPAALFAAGQALRAVLALGEVPGYTPPPGLPYLVP